MPKIFCNKPSILKRKLKNYVKLQTSITTYLLQDFLKNIC